jgi:hypothetical protein
VIIIIIIIIFFFFERPTKLSVSGHRFKDDKNSFDVLADNTGHRFGEGGI